MAIYSFQCSIVGRTQKTNNAVGKAAYINRLDMKNEYDGTTWKFKNRSDDVGCSAVLLPENCPERFSDPSVLWSEVELFETRRDSRLARDFIVALPNNLTLEQNKDLVEDFIKSNFTNEGMISNYAIHIDNKENIHCHIMNTLREVNSEGFAQKNVKGREWNKKENLEKWRANFADTTNKHLAKNNINEKVDHRSIEKQKEELLNNAVNAKNKKEELEHLRDYLKLDNVKPNERVSRKEYENTDIKEERAQQKKETTQKNSEIDRLIDSKVLDLKRVKKPKTENKQQTERRSKMFNILYTISNLYDDLKNSVSKVFNTPEQKPQARKFPKPRPGSSSSSSKKKKEDEFTGHSIDSVARREFENSNNAQNEVINDKVDNKRKLTSAQQFQLDKKSMAFAYTSNNINDFKAVLDIPQSKRSNAFNASQVDKKNNIEPPKSQFHSKDVKSGFTQFMKDKKDEKINRQNNNAIEKENKNNPSKGYNDFANKQNEQRNNRQNDNNNRQENKSSSAPAPGKRR